MTCAVTVGDTFISVFPYSDMTTVLGIVITQKPVPATLSKDGTQSSQNWASKGVSHQAGTCLILVVVKVLTVLRNPGAGEKLPNSVPAGEVGRMVGGWRDLGSHD